MQWQTPTATLSTMRFCHQKQAQPSVDVPMDPSVAQYYHFSSSSAGLGADPVFFAFDFGLDFALVLPALACNAASRASNVFLTNLLDMALVIPHLCTVNDFQLYFF